METEMDNKKQVSSAFDGEKLTARSVLKLMIQGAIVGAGGIIPGVSGGILCVAFGLYMPLMQFFSDPIREIPKTWKKWMCVGIGGCIGLLRFAFALDAVFEASEAVAKSLFCGLILGTFPSLIRESKTPPKGTTPREYGKKGKTIAFTVGFLFAMALFTFLAYISGTTAFTIEPNVYWFCLCGFIVGMGFVIPGLTSSTVLIFLGLLQPMLDGATHFDFAVIIPVGIGVGLAVLILARIMRFIFGKFYGAAFCSVIGAVLASAIVIIPRSFSGVIEVAVSIIAGLLGLFCSLFIDKKLSGYEK